MPSALTWLHVNHLINGLHKQISCKNCLYVVNSYSTILVATVCQWCSVKSFPISQLLINNPLFHENKYNTKLLEKQP